jgi:hypothetical protein
MFLIKMREESNIIVEYCNTMVAPAQVILLSKVLKFPKHIFLKEKNFVKEKKRGIIWIIFRILFISKRNAQT